MLRTGQEYRDSLRDGRVVWMDGKRIEDVAIHPAFKPLVDIRAHIYDMQHTEQYSDLLSYTDDDGERNAVLLKMPYVHEDWHQKRKSVEVILNEIGGVVTRVGDETVGEMWSLYDGSDVLAEIDPRFAENIKNHIDNVIKNDVYHVSANTDPKGDRSKRPQDQDPDMLLHVVKETDAGIVIRGAKYETASAYAEQAFVKPTIANWGDQKLSDYAVGVIAPMNAPGLTHICRSGFSNRASPKDYPLANKFDEIDTLMIFDDVLIPWEDILFYQHTRAATFIRATLHRYSAFAFVHRIMKTADMMIGAAMFNVRQTGLDKQQAVREKLAHMVCYREGINAHLTAAIASAQVSPKGLLMPNPSLLYTGRVLACSQLPNIMHLARELCGGQICITPDHTSFEAEEIKPWLEKYYSINEEWLYDDRRKLLALARDLLNSDYAGHKLTFQLFAQSPPFAHLNAVYMNYDFSDALKFVKKAAGLSDRITTD